jgi:endonuclease/exonuclease/phosphatase family metal-dependent hydrolase
VVVTWNAAAGAGDLVELVGRLRRGDFTDRTPVAHFVLLLQEVYRTGGAVPARVPAGGRAPRRLGRPAAAIDIEHAARSLELSVFYAPAMRNGVEAEDRGNAIMTTEPLRQLEVLELPFERQRRIALLATVTGWTSSGERWQIRFANAHLETRAGLTRGGPAPARRRQARAIAEHLLSPRAPTIIAGDLNTSWGDDEPAVRDLRRLFPDAGKTPATTWAKAVLSARLDHLFAWLPGTSLTVSRISERFGSDHIRC